MNTQRLPILSLILIVGLAGCVGLTPFEEDQSGNEESTTATPDISYPDSYSESGITDPEMATSNEKQSLKKKDNMTMYLEMEYETGGISFVDNVTAQADFANEREYTLMDSEIGGEQFNRIHEYEDSGMRYIMSNSSLSDPEYSVSNGSGLDGSDPGEVWFTVDPNGTSPSDLWLTNASFGEATQVSHDGEPMFKYEATGVDDATPFVVEASNSTVEEFNGTLLVDQEGIIRSFAYSITHTTSEGEQETVKAKYHIYNLNNTSIEEPDWLEEAKSESEDPDPFEDEF